MSPGTEIMTVCLQEKAHVWGGGVIFVHNKGHVSVCDSGRRKLSTP